MKDVHGEDSRVYKTDVVDKDYSNVLGITVSGTIDRPLGSVHPRHPGMIYNPSNSIGLSIETVCELSNV